MAEGGSVFKMFERALGQAELFGDSPGEFTQGLALAGHYAANLFAGRANMIPESGDSSTVGDAGLKTLDDLFERLAQIRARARLCALPYDFDRLAGHLVAPRAQQAGFVANLVSERVALRVGRRDPTSAEGTSVVRHERLHYFEKDDYMNILP